MKVADFSTGDHVVVWILINVFAVVSCVFLSGHGNEHRISIGILPTMSVMV